MELLGSGPDDPSLCLDLLSLLIMLVPAYDALWNSEKFDSEELDCFLSH